MLSFLINFFFGGASPAATQEAEIVDLRTPISLSVDLDTPMREDA